MNEVIHRGAVYTRQMLVKLLYYILQLMKDKGKLLLNSNIILYLTIITKIKSVIKQLKERRWTKEDFYTLLA